MRVLVTGATGLIGRRLVERLTGDGVQVTALVRRPGALAEGPGLTVVVGDVEDRAGLDRAIAGCDAVVHLANATGVTDPARAEAINVGGTANVIAAARAAGARRIVFTSSISAQRARLGPYGSTKRAAEARLRESGVPFVILRPSLVYGGDSGLVVSLIGHLRGLPLMPVIGNGRIAIDPVHLDDVCAVIAACLTRDDVLGRSGPTPVASSGAAATSSRMAAGTVTRCAPARPADRHRAASTRWRSRAAPAPGPPAPAR